MERIPIIPRQKKPYRHSPEVRKRIGDAFRKLTDHGVLVIRLAYVRGSRTCGSVALGREFGVSDETILNIVNHRTYRHLPSRFELLAA